MAAISEMSYELICQIPECGVFSAPPCEVDEELEHEACDEQPPWISDDNDSDGDTDHADESRSELLLLSSDGSHPYLDMEAQQMQVMHERQQRLSEYCARMSAEQALTPAQQTVALKLVMHEAHRLQRQRDVLDPDTCDRMWKQIASSAVRDMFVEGHTFVQRRLSCMCIFNPHGGKKEYVDSDVDRLRRQSNQQAVLKALRMQAACGGSSAFLKAPGVEASPSSIEMMW